MGTPGMAGKVQTVLGAIDAAELGITLPHEHLLFDLSVWFTEPRGASDRGRAYQPVCLENLGWVRYHPYNNKDNWLMLDEQTAIAEALRYKNAGGVSLVEMSSIGLNRDALGLARISRATGLNIIMGAGFYLEPTWPPNLTEGKMVEEMVRDVKEGVGGTGIRAGIIGEVGTERFGRDRPMEDCYKMSLRATARAQKETGAAVNIHPGHSPESPIEIIELMDTAGADVSRVAMSHIDRTVFDHPTRVALAKTGCYLEYDLFSFEGWHQVRHVRSEDNPVQCNVTNDAGRIDEIMALIEDGFLKQILISHDNCSKHRLWRWGGPGYAHILENVVPLMRVKGMTEEEINTIMVENPKRLLQFV